MKKWISLKSVNSFTFMLPTDTSMYSGKQIIIKEKLHGLILFLQGEGPPTSRITYIWLCPQDLKTMPTLRTGCPFFLDPKPRRPIRSLHQGKKERSTFPNVSTWKTEELHLAGLWGDRGRVYGLTLIAAPPLRVAHQVGGTIEKIDENGKQKTVI
ncbi:uncharacterized protein [Hyperolius riggenbachi]|uniref:uncharacterized protein isoform X2 n=1 Tax=Hyperolius riggenbachi TaxID=752182 RepID=UPI0035A30626